MLNRGKLASLAVATAMTASIQGIAEAKAATDGRENFGMLRVGQKVSVVGRADAETAVHAKTVEIQRKETVVALEGTIQTVDPSHDRLNVLGITVVVPKDLWIKGPKVIDPKTKRKYKPRFKLDAVKTGSTIKVAGMLEEDGSVTATKLALRADDDPKRGTRVVCEIEAIDEKTRTLKVLGIDARVLPDAAIRINKLPDRAFDDLDVGDMVKLTGTSTGSGGLIISQIKAVTSNKISVEGPVVANLSAMNMLVVMGVTVVPTKHAMIIDPLKKSMALSAFPVGRWAHADGTLRPDGTLRAVLIRLKKYKPTDFAEVVGVVQAVDPEHKSFTVLGRTIYVERHSWVHRARK